MTLCTLSFFPVGTVTHPNVAVPARLDPDLEYSHLVGSFVRSPRQSHIRDVGDRTIATGHYKNWNRPRI